MKFNQGVDDMKPRSSVAALATSVLSLAIMLAGNNMVVAQDLPNQLPDRGANPSQPDPNITAQEDECSNAPNNVGQGAVENAQPGNPNAPADVQGSRSQQNTGSARAGNDNTQLAQNEDNCFDAHEDPSTNENVEEPTAANDTATDNSPGTQGTNSGRSTGNGN